MPSLRTARCCIWTNGRCVRVRVGPVALVHSSSFETSGGGKSSYNGGASCSLHRPLAPASPKLAGSAAPIATASGVQFASEHTHVACHGNNPSCVLCAVLQATFFFETQTAKSPAKRPVPGSPVTNPLR